MTAAHADPLAIHESSGKMTPGQWGIIAFLGSEVAFFSTLIVAYVIFYGRDSLPGGLGGPTPREALSVALAICTTICLLLSSVTVHFADHALKRGEKSKFIALWIATIALGIAFLAGTAYEWTGLIMHDHLTISRNLFGTTFYTLVGFHAFHVTMGVIVMLVVLCMAWRGQLVGKNRQGVELVSWYWHFVDVVWIVVFTIVYLSPHLS